MKTDLGRLSRMASVLKSKKMPVGSDVYGNLYYENRKDIFRQKEIIQNI